MVELSEVVSDFVAGADFDVPFMYTCISESGAIQCNEASDMVDCFMDYISDRGFDVLVDEEPSAITRLDYWFDMFIEDCISPVKAGGDA